MKRQNLNDNWTLTILGDNVYHIPQEPLPVTVPGSVYSGLLENQKMPDPFWRDNELDALKLMENNFLFRETFTADPAVAESDRIILRFDGIDTIADVTLNGVFLGHAENMHKKYEFDVTEILKAGDTSGFAGNDAENVLEVKFYSPTKYIAAAHEKVATLESTDAMPGYSHLRKAHCMFGWDWGPRLPDAGFYRPVELLGIQKGRISEDVRIHQEHTAGSVRLDAAASTDPAVLPGTHLEYTLVTPEGEERAFAAGNAGSLSADKAVESDPLPADKTVQSGALSADKAVESDPLPADKTAQSGGAASIDIVDPELWWPNGYGKQPLYTVIVRLVDDASGAELDRVEKRIGLRTVTVNTAPFPEEEKDPHIGPQVKEDTKEGRHFDFVVNGLPIFAMGADYIPEDNILNRVNPDRTRRLLEDTAEAHSNCIRVWGGGYYPDDFFFDICDELGLLVWQDFMFACASYDLNDAFEDNIKAEFVDVVRRLRHHASLALWCGNNEMETQVLDAWNDGSLPHKKQLFDYIKIYEYIIPKILKAEDPDRFYWPSSPSSGGNYEDANEENMGDAHYWGVWHGGDPFPAYRAHHFRFLSEFGFQSFPCTQTIAAFTEPADRNVFSEIMEMHQRNSAANGKIMNYLSATYRYPKDFDSLVYCSQMLQLDAIRYGVEYFRRIRGTCMGTVVWQLNDIWPVASWASIDYYGRWKALQYGEKRFFAPVSITCEEHGRLDQKPFANSLPIPVEYSAALHVANETWNEVRGVVRWKLCRPDSSVIQSGEEAVTVPAFGGTWLEKRVFNGAADERDMNLFYEFLVNADCAERIAGTDDVVITARNGRDTVGQPEESGWTGDNAGQQVVSRGSCLFVAPKYYHFADPHLALSVDGDAITVHADAYAKGVCIESEDGNLRLSDNFFDMEKGDYTVKIVGEKPTGEYRVRSVYDIA